jgi:Rrf2 family transcriptional regulator, iron-sulfur cluster assembly transcription factor
VCGGDKSAEQATPRYGVSAIGRGRAVTRAADLALALMLEIARCAQDRPVRLQDAAAGAGASISHAEQLAAALRRRGLIKGTSGQGGGYRLSRPAAGISVLDIVLAVDSRTRGRRHGRQRDAAIHSPAARECWSRVEKIERLILERVSLADVARGYLADHPFLQRFLREAGRDDGAGRCEW